MWPIDAGFGGSVGHVVMNLATFETGIVWIDPSQKLIVAGISAVFGVWLMFMAATVSMSATLSGMMTVLRGCGAGLAAFVATISTRFAAAPETKPTKAKRERTEPIMGATSDEPIVERSAITIDAPEATDIDMEGDDEDFEAAAPAPKAKDVVVQRAKPTNQPSAI
jgi:hypothetical protein